MNWHRSAGAAFISMAARIGNQALVISISLVLAAGCKEPAPQPPLPNSTGPCHLPGDYAPPACEGKPPANLSSLPLGTGFFADVYQAVGLTGVYGRRVTFGDVDSDRYPDFIAVQTGVTPGLQHLYFSRPNLAGAGRLFVEAAIASGIQASRAGGVQTALMVAFGDVDHDGDLDLFSGSYSQVPSGTGYVADPNEIYLNDGTGVFTLKLDSGIDKPWPLTTAAAVFLDYDLDGRLDLFVGNFEIDYPDLASYQDHLYRGAGDGTFTIENDSARITTSQPIGASDGMYAKPTYGATSCDWNDDGWPDILTSTYALGWNDLWANQGDGTFVNLGQPTGYFMDAQDNPAEAAYRDGGNTFACACGDYDNDGDLDLMTAETAHGDYPRSTADRSRILRNTGAAGGWVFERPDLSATGIDRELNGTGPGGEWGNEGDHGVDWADLDNDGLLDLIIEQSAYPHNHAWLFHQLPDHSFVDVTGDSGVASNLVNSNGLTVDDYDRDGDLDVLMGSVNTGSQPAPGGVEQLHLYENRIGSRNRFLYVTLRGVTANRQGIGARIYLTAGCLIQLREIGGGKGTFGAADPAYAHFGLGSVERVDRLEVHWPTNPPKVQIFYNLAPNQFLEITEGSGDLACQAR